MGVTIEGDRLGLGANLFSSKDTLIEEYGDDASKNLKGPSDFLYSLGSFDLSEDMLAHSLSDTKLTAKVGKDGTATFKLGNLKLGGDLIKDVSLLVTLLGPSR